MALKPSPCIEILLRHASGGHTFALVDFGVIGFGISGRTARARLLLTQRDNLAFVRLEFGEQVRWWFGCGLKCHIARGFAQVVACGFVQVAKMLTIFEGAQP